MKRSRTDEQSAGAMCQDSKRSRFCQYNGLNKRKPHEELARPTKHQKITDLTHSKAKQLFEQELLALETFVHTQINFATAAYPVIQRVKYRTTLLGQHVKTFPLYAERLQKLIAHTQAMRRASLLTLKKLKV